jgi:threonine synthase
MTNSIKYYSTNHKAVKVNFEDALIKGLAPDKGLYMPEHIPQLSKEEIDRFSDMEYHEIAYTIFSKFLGNEIPDSDLRKMTKDAYDFDIPLENVYDRKYIMRLDQGPTASFKDFAGRMMGQWMQYYLKKKNKKLTILTATSGDTGSAMANAFFGLENIKVVILFPKSEISDRQRKQMTTLQNNIQIIGIDGKFDDCQAMVKEAFADKDLDYLNLSSSNSINIGRLLPQIVYYAYAYSRLRKKDSDEKIIFSIPSGNFGDMMGGVLGKHLGLPIEKFIIAVNDNDEFPKLIQTHQYHKIEPSRNSLSNAMNVGHPSNLARLIQLYGGNMDEKGNILQHPNYDNLSKDIYTESISNEDTKSTIKEVYENYKVLLEPHGSVGWTSLQNYLKKYGDEKEQIYVCLETAHPAKFPSSIIELLDIDPELPISMQNLDDKTEAFDTIENNYESFKSYLIKNY